MKKEIVWRLHSSSIDEPTKEINLFYTDGVRIFSLRPHPTKAFCFHFPKLIGVTTRQANKLLLSWIEKAIGPAEEYNDRIKEFTSSI